MSPRSLGDQLKFAQSEISRSKRWRDDEEYDDNWKRWVDLYRGRQYEGGDSPNDQLIVNIVFATINVMLPAVAINNPRFVVNARKPETPRRRSSPRRSSTTCGAPTSTSVSSVSPFSTVIRSATAGSRSATSS